MVTIAFNERSIVDTTQLLGFAGAAISGMLVGAAASYWHLSQVAARLRQRLDHVESVRNAEVQRAAQARAQIAQLSQAITELRRSHSVQVAQMPDGLQQPKRSNPDEESSQVAPRSGQSQAFADTQVMA